MNKKKNIIGITIAMIGLCIFMYPIVKQGNAKRIQNQLMNEIKDVITENIQNSSSNELNKEESEVSIDDQYTNLSLLEDDNAQEQSALQVRDRLKNQQVMGIIEIDKIDLIYAVVEGTSDDNLGVAIGHMINTAEFGQVGNCALAGHRGGTSGPYFKDLHKLEQGDQITLTDAQGIEYTYRVTESFLVEPNDVWVAENKTEEKLLTLITCQDNATKRLIVRAIVDEKKVD